MIPSRKNGATSGPFAGAFALHDTRQIKTNVLTLLQWIVVFPFKCNIPTPRFFAKYKLLSSGTLKKERKNDARLLPSTQADD